MFTNKVVTSEKNCEKDTWKVVWNVIYVNNKKGWSHNGSSGAPKLIV